MRGGKRRGRESKRIGEEKRKRKARRIEITKDAVGEEEKGEGGKVKEKEERKNIQDEV